jgi:hypothetical protein
MSLCDNINSNAAPFTGQQPPVHTQRFAFRASKEDDESVKMSNTTSRRARAFTPAPLGARPRLKRAQNNNFYSIQMNLHKSLLTTHQPPIANTRRIP